MLRIREIRTGDRAAFLRLMKQVHELHCEARPDIYRPYDRALMEQYFREVLAKTDSFSLLAEADGAVCGLCNVAFRSTAANPVAVPRRVAYLEDFCVDGARRGQGVGRLLFQAAQERAVRAGADSLELTVWGFNEDARRFYEHLGMTERSRTLERKL